MKKGTKHTKETKLKISETKQRQAFAKQWGIVLDPKVGSGKFEPFEKKHFWQGWFKKNDSNDTWTL